MREKEKKREREMYHYSLSSLSVIAEKYSELYAFHYRPKEGEMVKQSSGWALFDSQNEYSRMGVPNELWRSTSLNYEYEVCISIPVLWNLTIMTSCLCIGGKSVGLKYGGGHLIEMRTNVNHNVSTTLALPLVAVMASKNRNS